MSFVITIALALLGWSILRAIKMPAAALLGPMLFIGSAKVWGLELATFPDYITGCLQVMLGLFVGAKIDREKVEFLKKGMVVPTLMVAAWTIVSALAATMVLFFSTELNNATILFGATPGGIAEMSLIALLYDADVAIVSLLQFSRLVMVLIFVPVLVSGYARYYLKEGAGEIVAATETPSEENCPRKCSLILVTSGVIAGFTGIYLGIPGGGIVGTALAVGMLGIVTRTKLSLHHAFLLAAQAGTGITIGLHFSSGTIAVFTDLMLPVILFSAMMVVSGVLLSFILARMTKWDLATCLLCAAPAGISQMVIYASEMRIDIVKVTFFHVVRLLTIYLLVNQIYQVYLLSNH